MKKILDKNDQKAYLLSKIGSTVIFRYPEPPYVLKGKLVDRYAISLGYGDEWVDYWMIIDLIRFEGEAEDWIRITYYRYKKKEMRWVFAGQTALAIPISGFQELFVKAIKEKEWMKDLFKGIMNKISL